MKKKCTLITVSELKHAKKGFFSVASQLFGQNIYKLAEKNLTGQKPNPSFIIM